jgi:hypothetical protein
MRKSRTNLSVKIAHWSSSGRRFSWKVGSFFHNSSLKAERVRQQRLRGEVGDDDQEIRRLEAKLRKSKKRKNKAASDGSDDDDDELEKILFNGSTSEED